MKTHAQYLVIFRDGPKTRSYYYGPFVSESIANSFMDRLPEPSEGGLKTFKFISPYNYDEADIASDVILNARNPDHPIAAIEEQLQHNLHRILLSV